jgi:ABC-type transporter MlaC component
MVTDKAAYEELIDYLTTSKSIFHNDAPPPAGMPTIQSLIEEEIAEQVISLCTQHQELEANHRAVIIREVDGIVYDIEQVLTEYWKQNATESQAEFIHEFAGLIKNIFDSAVAELID